MGYWCVWLIFPLVFFNRALADHRSTGAGIKCLYCSDELITVYDDDGDDDDDDQLITIYKTINRIPLYEDDGHYKEDDNDDEEEEQDDDHYMMMMMTN